MYKKALLFSIWLIIGLCAYGQTYVGTMRFDNFTQRSVTVKLSKTAQGDVQMTLYHVKFARMMPVHVDVTIPGLRLDGIRLTGDNEVPVSKKKHYDKYTVHRFVGTADADRLDCSCMMGDKKLTFKGNRKK